MTSAIGGMGGMYRPSPTQMTDSLFSKIDTKGKGYIDKTDLQTAFDQISSSSDSSSTSVSDIFSALDGDGNGQITKEEMTSGLQTLVDQLDSQFNSARTSQSGNVNAPPPPPPGKDEGLSKEQLSKMTSDATSGSQQATELANLVQNFDAADTDGDGKVSFREAMAYKDSTSSSESTSSTTTSASTSTASGQSLTGDASVMKRIMQLIHAYGALNPDSSQSTSSGSLSVTA
jgi:Ca2+-binding EF-hand superfamily protein